MEIQHDQRPSKPPPPPVPPKPKLSVSGLNASSEVCPVLCESTNTKSPKSSTEDQVDALTNILMLNLEQASTVPDFYGMCSRCGEAIKGAQGGCTAMDKFYHITCFTCQDCGRALTGRSFYAVKNRSMCEGCYVNTLEKCSQCNLPVTERILRATGRAFHPECFVCTHCKKSLDGVPFTVDAHNAIHCIEDFHMKYAPRCSVCRSPILPEQDGEETVRVVALDRNFHVNCYKCEDCGVVMSSEADGKGCYPLDGKLLCKSCNAVRVQAIGTGEDEDVAATDL